MSESILPLGPAPLQGPGASVPARGLRRRPRYYECLLAVGERPARKDIGIVPSREELEDRRAWLGDWAPDFDLEAARAKCDR